MVHPEGSDRSSYAAEAERERPLSPATLRDLAEALEASGGVRTAATARELADELERR